MTDADMAREHTSRFLEVIQGEAFARPDPRPMFPNPPGLLRIEPQSPGLLERIWVGGPGSRPTARHDMNLMSSTLLVEDTGVPFHQLQAEQIQRYSDAWTAAGHDRAPRVSVSRSIFPIVDDLDKQLFWRAHSSGRGLQRPRRRGGSHPPGPGARLALSSAFGASEPARPRLTSSMNVSNRIDRSHV